MKRGYTKLVLGTEVGRLARPGCSTQRTHPIEKVGWRDLRPWAREIGAGRKVRPVEKYGLKQTSYGEARE